MKRVEFKQENSYSCGSVCIQSLVAYYKGYVPLSVINEDLHLTKNGTNALFMINALKKYGFDAGGFKVSSLDNLSVPFIAHINGKVNHFVVVYKTGKKVLIMDPSTGFRKLDKDKFLKEFSGVIITATKVRNIKKYKRSNLIKNVIKASFLKNKIKIFIVTIISLFILLLSFIIASYTKVNSLLNRKIVLVFLLLTFVKFLLSNINIIFQLKLTTNFRMNMNDYLNQRIFRKDLKEFNGHSVGELINKINNFKKIETLVLEILFGKIIEILLITTSSIIFVNINFYLFLIYLLYEVIYSTLVIFLYKKFNFRFEILKNREIVYSSSIAEYLDSILTIKSLDLNDYVLNDLKEKYKLLLNHYERYSKEYTIFLNVETFLTDAFIILFNSFGIYLVNSRSLTYTSLICLNLIFTLTNNSFKEVLNSFIEILKSKYYIEGLNDFLEDKNKSNGIRINGFNDIQVVNYSYTYDHVNTVLRVNKYCIRSGEKILIKGANGSGKSTFAKSIAGLFTDYKGNILINGMDIKSINNVQDYVVYTSKNDKIFYGSIKENIMIKNSNKPLDEVIRLCKLNNLLSKKNLDLFETIGENLNNLSDGEKSQVILARSLYLDPKVLIIDELLSNLDQDLEDEILKNLFNNKELTLIYITHRNKNFSFDKMLKL